MLNTQDPRDRGDLQHAADEDGLTTATIASIAFVLLLFGGVALWAYYSDRSSTTSAQRPGIERSAPPATIGQGGAASKMPAAKDAP
jgi:hypothetical protein